MWSDGIMRWLLLSLALAGCSQKTVKPETKGLPALPGVLVESDKKLPESVPPGPPGKVFARASRQMRKCYEPHLRVNPELAGTVWLEFRLSADGSVEEVRVAKSSLNGPERYDFEQCLVQVGRRLRFDPSAASEKLVQSWHFAPGSL